MQHFSDTILEIGEIRPFRTGQQYLFCDLGLFPETVDLYKESLAVVQLPDGLRIPAFIYCDPPNQIPVSLEFFDSFHYDHVDLLPACFPAFFFLGPCNDIKLYDHILLFEDPVELMSFHQLHPYMASLPRNLLLSFPKSKLTLRTMDRLIALFPHCRLTCCFPNDHISTINGLRIAARTISNKLTIAPYGADDISIATGDRKKKITVPIKNLSLNKLRNLLGLRFRMKNKRPPAPFFSYNEILRDAKDKPCP